MVTLIYICFNYLLVNEIIYVDLITLFTSLLFGRRPFNLGAIFGQIFVSFKSIIMSIYKWEGGSFSETS